MIPPFAAVGLFQRTVATTAKARTVVPVHVRQELAPRLFIFAERAKKLVNALKEVSRHPPTKTFKLMVVRT